jgi:hypothetical protein
MQQVTMLHTMHQTTQQQLTQAQQMLHEMQHRYDRLLDAPRSPPPSGVDRTADSLAAHADRVPTDADTLRARTPPGIYKLSPCQAAALRAKRQRGTPIKALMAEYGISKATVFRYLAQARER